VVELTVLLAALCGNRFKKIISSDWPRAESLQVATNASLLVDNLSQTCCIIRASLLVASIKTTNPRQADPECEKFLSTTCKKEYSVCYRSEEVASHQSLIAERYSIHKESSNFP
jgi:hypothetical protein